MKSGNLNFLEYSGPLQACNGTDLHFILRERMKIFRAEIIFMMELKGKWKILKSDCTREMQAAIQLKTRAEDRIHRISHRKRKFRASGFKSMNLARSLQKVDEILNNFGNNKIQRSQIITTRHNVHIFTYRFHLHSEKKRKQGNITKWLILAKCICSRYKTHVPMAKLHPPPTLPPKWHKILYLANFILWTSITIPCSYSFHEIAVSCQNVESHNSFSQLMLLFSQS